MRTFGKIKHILAYANVLFTLRSKERSIIYGYETNHSYRGSN
jgi:hypothetical protein